MTGLDRAPAAGFDAADEAVAVVGLSGRFPGARNAGEFWANLSAGVESVEVLGEEELLAAGVGPEVWGRAGYVRAAPRFAGMGEFDAEFFGYSAREAQLMDPQHRVFLQEAWHALEDAGHDPAQFPGSIGVFAGASTSAYLENIFSNLDHGARIRGENPGLSFELAFLAARVSYKLDLRGPSVPVQTACSTALVAVHNACQSLLDYECDMALAGAAAYKVRENTGYLFREGGFLSPDGHVRPFDAGARGTVFGSGVGVVVLRRLSDALADGDVVWAVLRGSGVNNDGAVKVSFTAPSVSGQAAVVAAAMESAGLVPGDIDYVEAHGTGTVIGDSIEVQALSRAFAGVPAGSVGLGSLKGNVGHLDAAAGMAGLLKVILALRAQVIPASLHFERANPEAGLSSGPFRVVGRPRAWPRSPGRPRRAGVSAFGFGGTNAHVIVEEAPLPVVGEPGADVGSGAAGGVRERDGAVLVVSARSAGGLRAVSDRLADAVEALAGEGPGGGARERRLLGDVAFTLGTGRRALEWRRAVTGTDVASVVAALRSEPGAGPGSPVAGPAPRVVFVATGQGAQHCGMARALYAQEPVFAREFDRCAAWVAAADAEPDAGGLAAQLREELARAGLTGGQVAGSAELAGMPGLDGPLGASWPPEDLPGLAAGGLRGGADLRWVVLADPSAGGTWAPAAARLLARTCWAQPALWCVEMALARLWQSWGIAPQAVVGHSLGEWTAAVLAGVFNLRTAARLVVARGWLMQRQPAGAMATVLADPDEVAALLDGPGAPPGGSPPGLSVAAWNGPGECVVSGPTELVAAFGSAAARRGWGVQPIPGGHGFHSALMDAAVPAFRDRVARELARAAREAGPGVPAGQQQLEIPFTSNVTGGWITAEQARDPDYWARHIRAGVRFADNIATVLDGQPDTVLLEIGPGRALTSLIRRTLSGPAHTALASLPHRDDTRTAADTVRRALAELWTRGLHPRWHDYYRHHPHHRLPLPTYPFQPTHHWLPSAPERAETPAALPGGAHPLLDETVLDGADESVYRTRFGLSRQWVLSEHKLLGEAIVPGTTYLEMAAVAGEWRLGRPITMVRDVTFRTPLLVTIASEVDVFITIRDAGDDQATFTVASRQVGERACDGWVTHARGTVSAAPLAPVEPLDPMALRARCRVATVDAGALQAEHQVMDFGPRWELTLKQVHVGVRSALGELALPAEYAAECSAFRLHPALLDLATGFGALAVLDSGDDLAELRGERDFYLPVGYDAIEIHRPLPTCGLSQITPRPDQKAHARIRVVDVLVCDEDGQVALVIRGFTAGRVADPALTVTRLRPHQRHHRLRWEPAPPPADADVSFADPVLIVGASADRAMALAGELRSAGVTPRIALIDEAAAADGGSSDADGVHRLPPTATALVGLVTRAAPRQLVFVAAAAAAAGRPERLRAELDRGVYPLFHLLKAAATAGGLDRLDIVAPTVRPVTGGERQLAPQHATLFGLAKVFGQEQGGCAVRCIDDDGDAAAVCAELRRASATSLVALRGGARWAQVLTPADARGHENAESADLTGDAQNYLITGGLGGLGLAVAEHLSAQRPTARIALVGRSLAPAPQDWATLAAAIPPASITAAAGDRLPDVLGKDRRQARALHAMRERGTKVRTFPADVADEAAMREIVTRLTAEWGPLDCVVHAAGVAGDGFLFRKDADAFAATLAPKVLGAAVLDTVTDGDAPPRIITFGSTVTVFGAVGQGDYTAANDYLAAFADARSARGRPTATLAWSDWLEVGMAVDNAVAEHQGFFRSLTPAEALSSFDLLADGREPNMIIGEINTARLGASPVGDLDAQFRHAPVLPGEHVREVLARAGRAAPAVAPPKREAAAPAEVVLLGREDGNYTPSERTLGGMWADELGLESFDITASSFTLGGDSLTALRMAARIEKVMNISVSVIDIFQYETIAELAMFLDSQFPGAKGPE